LSSPAKAGDPVRGGLSAQVQVSLEYWIPAFAGTTNFDDALESLHTFRIMR